MADDRSEEFGRRLVGAIPAAADAVTAHQRDYGGIQPVPLLHETLRMAVVEVRRGDGDRLDRLAGFVGVLLADPDPAWRAAATSGFVDLAATWVAGPQLDQLMASWPPVVRTAVEERRGRRVRVLDRVWAEFGGGDGDGVGPAVEAVWALPGTWAAVAADGGVLFAVGHEVVAIDVREVHRLWEYSGHRGEALEDSGGVVVHRIGSEAIEVFAPFEYCVRLDRRTGAEIAWSARVASEGSSSDAQSFPEHPVRDFVVERTEAGSVEISDVAGTVLLTLTAEPSIDPPQPLQVGDLLILPLESGDLLAVRRTRADDEARGGMGGPAAG